MSEIVKDYIQYVVPNGSIYAKPVIRIEARNELLFLVDNINDNYFIVALFVDNVQVNRVSFVDVQNVPMLAFINSNNVDLDVIPQDAFFNAHTDVSLKIPRLLQDDIVLPLPVQKHNVYGLVRPAIATKMNFEINALVPLTFDQSVKKMLVHYDSNLQKYSADVQYASIGTDEPFYPQTPLYDSNNAYGNFLHQSEDRMFVFDDIFLRVIANGLNVDFDFNLIVYPYDNFVIFDFDRFNWSIFSVQPFFFNTSTMYITLESKDLYAEVKSYIGIFIDWKQVPFVPS